MKQANITYPQLITLYEVSRKINSQLNFPKLLDEIMDVAIELLHAEKGVIFLRKVDSDGLVLQVARSMDKRSMDEVVAFSSTIVKKVETEGKPVLLEKVPDTGGKLGTTSLIRHKIKSVICVPLRARDKLIGTIYLDTTQSEHFFKKEDLVFVEGFANLAGIAIENAQTYHKLEDLNTNLEQLVEKRTEEVQEKHNELHKAYEELKETQMQLIRSEKMASLGQLVAGIAHEINTPLGSIRCNTDTFIRGFEKLDKELSSNKNASQKTIATLENLSQVNKLATERISKIVTTLRNFARLDEEEFKTVDLHEGIDSTLALIAHLSRDHVKIVKEYGEIPKLKCYANQLNQVFMNLLVNSCQAIEGKGEILIKTFQENESIHLQFSDDGVGIPRENLQKIFDPGFTTKGVGVGTGLGLSISYRIVEEHGGEIEVDSEVGEGTTFTIKLPINHQKHK